MTATAGIEVYGVKEAIKELRNIDPQLRRDLNRDAKEIAAPIVNAAKANYPAVLLSGMKYNWNYRKKSLKFPYIQAKAQRGVQVKVDTSKKNQGTIVVIQKDPAASIYDMAGKKGGDSMQGSRFISALTLHFGPPSRVMWPAAEANMTSVNGNMVDLIASVMEQVNRNMVTP